METSCHRGKPSIPIVADFINPSHAELMVTSILACSSNICGRSSATPDQFINSRLVDGACTHLESREVNASLAAAQTLLATTSIRDRVLNYEYSTADVALRVCLPFTLDVVDATRVQFQATPLHRPIPLSLPEAGVFLARLERFLCVFGGADSAMTQHQVGETLRDLVCFYAPEDEKTLQKARRASNTTVILRMGGAPGEVAAHREHVTNPLALLTSHDADVGRLLLKYPRARALFRDGPAMAALHVGGTACGVFYCNAAYPYVNSRFCGMHHEVVSDGWYILEEPSRAPVALDAGGLFCVELPGQRCSGWIGMRTCTRCDLPSFACGPISEEEDAKDKEEGVRSKWMCEVCCAKDLNRKSPLPGIETLEVYLQWRAFRMVFDGFTGIKLGCDSQLPSSRYDSFRECLESLHIEQRSVPAENFLEEDSLSSSEEKFTSSTSQFVEPAASEPAGRPISSKLARVLELLELKLPSGFKNACGKEFEQAVLSRVRSEYCRDGDFFHVTVANEAGVRVDLSTSEEAALPQIAMVREAAGRSMFSLVLETFADLGWENCPFVTATRGQSCDAGGIGSEKFFIPKFYGVGGFGWVLRQCYEDVQIRQMVVQLGAAREMALASATLDAAHAEHSARTRALGVVARCLVDGTQVLSFEEGLLYAARLHEVLDSTASIFKAEVQQSGSMISGPGAQVEGLLMTKLSLDLVERGREERVAVLVKMIEAGPPSRSHAFDMVREGRELELADSVEVANEQRALACCLGLSKSTDCLASSSASMTRMADACDKDRLALQEYAEESEALRLALRLRDEARTGVQAGMVSALVELTDLLEQEGWIRRAQEAAEVLRRVSPRALRLLLQNIKVHKVEQQRTNPMIATCYHVAIRSLWHTDGEVKAMTTIQALDTLHGRFLRQGIQFTLPMWSAAAAKEPTPPKLSLLKTPRAFALSLVSMLNGCLAETPLDPTAQPACMGQDEERLRQLLDSLRNGHLLSHCEMAQPSQGTPKVRGSWTLVETPSMLLLDGHGCAGSPGEAFGPPGLGLSWVQRTELKKKGRRPRPVTQTEAALVRAGLVSRGLDPRLFSAHGPTFTVHAARLLLHVGATLSSQDILLKQMLAWGVVEEGSDHPASANNGRIVALSARSASEYSVTRPVPMSLLAPLCGTGITIEELRQLPCARALAGVAQRPQSSSNSHALATPQPPIVSEIISGLLSVRSNAEERYIDGALLQRNTRVPPRAAAQDWARSLSNKDGSAIRHHELGGLCVYTRQNVTSITPGTLRSILKYAADNNPEPHERFRFVNGKAGTEHMHPTINSGFFPNATLGILRGHTDINGLVHPRTTANLRTGSRRLHFVKSEQFYNPSQQLVLSVVDLDSDEYAARHGDLGAAARLGMAYTYIMTIVARASHPATKLSDTDALLLIELAAFPANMNDERFVLLAAKAREIREKYMCIANNCGCVQLEPEASREVLSLDETCNMLSKMCPRIGRQISDLLGV